MSRLNTLSIAIMASLVSANALASAETDSIFTFFDTDKNNQISLKEFKTGGMDSEGDAWNQGLSTVCTEKTLSMVEPELTETFKHLDDNKDKQVSREEFAKNANRIYDEYWQASFKEADKDNNKHLSRKEYEAQAGQYVKRLKESYQQDKVPVECKADVEYWQAYYTQIDSYVGESFVYLDNNKDNKLNFNEYIGEHLR